ncbi:MAG: glycosyltransferase [Candidatus Omnitrophica bacterium]|nr:glycosyltransferase [Candidatus Omnitrophota bacterium]
MRPKILYLVDNLLIGGAQMQLARLVHGLGDQDFDLRVLALGDTHPRLMQIIGARRVAVFPMMCIWKPGFWLSYQKVRHAVRAIKPDIVHTYLNTSNVFGGYTARQSKVPIIVTSRRDMGRFRSRRIAAMERWSNKFCHRVVCVSEAVKQQTVANEGLDPAKAVVLYSGVEVPTAPQRDASRGGALTVGMVASADRVEKGHMDFLQVAREVYRKNREIRFVIVGDGHLRPELERFADQEGIRPVVDFRGRSSDVPSEVRKFDIFVMPSHTEGFSNAVLEAMAMGVPVLANALEGNLEIIDDGVNGMLVEPRNTAQMSGQILAYAARRPDLRAMGERARAKIEAHFTLKHMVERYKTFYNELLNG